MQNNYKRHTFIVIDKRRGCYLIKHTLQQISYILLLQAEALKKKAREMTNNIAKMVVKRKLAGTDPSVLVTQNLKLGVKKQFTSAMDQGKVVIFQVMLSSCKGVSVFVNIHFSHNLWLIFRFTKNLI